jgi:hypothetical protein
MPQLHFGALGPILTQSRIESTGTILAQLHCELSGSIFAHFRIEQSGAKMTQLHSGSTGPTFTQPHFGATGANIAQLHDESTGSIFAHFSAHFYEWPQRRSIIECERVKTPNWVGMKKHGLTKERPGGLSQGEKTREGVAALLCRRSYFMKFRRGLFVLGKDDIDLRVRGDGNDDAAVRIEIHHFGVARRANVFGQPLPQHVIF